MTNPLTRHFTVTASAPRPWPTSIPAASFSGSAAATTPCGRSVSGRCRHGGSPTSVPKIRELVAGRPIDVDGAEVRIRWADEQVPIMMPATGPKNLRVAGALADIVMVYVGVNPVSVRWAIEHVRAGRRGGGA